MAIICNNQEELANALNRDEPEIIIANKALKNHVRYIMGISNIAWGFLIVVVIWGVVSFFASPSFGSIIWSIIAIVVVSVLVLGYRTALFACALVYASGGVRVFHQLRTYSMSKTNKNNLRLSK